MLDYVQLKLQNKKKLSVDTGMGSSHADSVDIDNW
jgi:hypothetical protein